METEFIKQTFRLGNSSGVILPREWENKKVRIQLIDKSINKDIFEILEKNDLLGEVIGIYLVGSYARNEETPQSDIDVLVITNNTNKSIKQGLYELTLISKERFEKNIHKSLYIVSLINDSKTILNNSFMEEYKKISPKFSVKRHLGEIKDIIKTNEDIINFDEKFNQKVLDGIAYSIVLRLRELYLLNNLIKNKKPSNKEFLKLINSLDAMDYYEAYLRVKNDKPEKNDLSTEKAKKLLDSAKKLIKKIEHKKKFPKKPPTQS